MPTAPLAHLLANVAGWLTLRHAIVMLSILAYVVNISGIIPQLRAMLRVRSAQGQSPLGWVLAGSCSASLMFVNLVGYHALLLAVGKLKPRRMPGGRPARTSLPWPGRSRTGSAAGAPGSTRRGRV